MKKHLLKLSNLKHKFQKKTIGRWFFATGFIGAMFGAYLNMASVAPIDYLSPRVLSYIYWAIYLSFLGVWYALFDYMEMEKEVKKQ